MNEKFKSGSVDFIAKLYHKRGAGLCNYLSLRRAQFARTLSRITPTRPRLGDVYATLNKPEPREGVFFFSVNDSIYVSLKIFTNTLC